MLHLRANIQSRSPSELHNVDPFSLAPQSMQIADSSIVFSSLDTTGTQLANLCEWFRPPVQQENH